MNKTNHTEEEMLDLLWLLKIAKPHMFYIEQQDAWNRMTENWRTIKKKNKYKILDTLGPLLCNPRF